MQDPVGTGRSVVCSFAQEHLWLACQLATDKSLYNIATPVRITGALRVDALARAINLVVERHEVFRYQFDREEHGIHAHVVAHRTLPLPVIDLSSLNPDDRDRLTHDLIEQDAYEPFDLKRPPLLRCSVLRIANDDHILRLTVHHLAFDGWSVGIFWREITDAYESEVAGRPSTLPVLPVSYGDFAHWQRGQAAKTYQSQIEYWRNTLGGAGELDLPSSRPYRTESTSAGASEPVEIPAALIAEIRALGRAHGCTLFMTLLASWQVLLSRLTGQTDVVVGTALNHRLWAESHRLIGYFVNTVALRTDLNGAPTFAEVLTRVRRTTLEAFENAEVPFAAVVQAMHADRKGGANAYVRVMFGLQAPRPRQLAASDLQFTLLDVPTRTTRFDLSLQLIEGAARTFGVLTYSTELFSETMARRVVSCWLSVMRDAIKRPGAQIHDLVLLDSTERARLLHSEDASTDPDTRSLLHEAVERFAAREPTAPALVHGGTSTTYGELNESAERWAQALAVRGVGSETRVAIYAHLDVTMAAMMLGVLKSGGCFVALDADMPTADVEVCLAAASPAMVLCPSALVDRLPARGRALAIVSEPAPARTIRRNRRTPKASPAYLHRVAGSAGAVQFMLVEHQHAARSIQTLTEQARIDDAAAVGVSSLSSGAELVTLFACWNRGGCVHLVPSARLVANDGLARYVDEHQLDFVATSPSAITAQSSNGTSARAGPCLILVGEPMSARAAAMLEQPHVMFPLGFAVATRWMCVLDARGEPVPVGIEGEVYVADTGVGREYVDAAALTAELFVPDHLSGRSGARLYRTAMRGRWCEDGSLEYLGRVETRVRVRAFRVELEDVEQTLRTQRGVAAAAAGVFDGQVVGYVVWAKHGERSWVDLSVAMVRSLPVYMVPTAWRALGALPLSVDGRLDRKRLPPPDVTEGESAEASVPRTATEELLTQIWCEVLHREHIGIRDNFFALGGDSIQTILIVAKAQKAGLALTAQAIFERQTIAALAEHLAVSPPALPSVARPAAAIAHAAPLTPVQRWFVEAGLSQPRHWNLSVLLSLDREHLDASRWRSSVEAVVERHDALRTCLRLRDDGWIQESIPLDRAWNWNVWDLSHQRREAQDRVLAERIDHAQQGVDHTDGPLVNAALIDLGPRGARLLLVVHHTAVDGVSWRIVLEDLRTAFTEQQAQHAALQPPATVRQWASQLEVTAHSDRVVAQRAYWTAGPASRRDLPCDLDSGDNDEGSLSWIDRRWDANWTTTLVRSASQVGRTDLQQLLVAAVAAAVVEWSGRDGLWLEMEAHGRDAPWIDVDVSQTVGWFTSLYPVWIAKPAEVTAAAWLSMVKDVLRSVPDQGIGYSLLRYLGPAECQNALRAQPTPSIGFNYLGQFDGILDEGLLRPASEPVGAQRGPGNRRRHLLSVTALIRRGELSVRWNFSRHRHRPATIEHLARRCAGVLDELALLCQRFSPALLAASDFPHARLDDRAVRLLAAKLS